MPVRKLGNAYTSRQTSGNIPIVGDGSLTTFKATSSMTTGKPPVDCHIIHTEWDNAGGYSAQLALSTTTPQRLFGRTMSDKTWGSWVEYKAIKPSEDWVFLGKAINTSAVTNGQVLKVDIPTNYRNCSLKVLCKLELSASGWVDLRAYDTNGNILKYTVNLVGSFSGGTNAFGSENMNYFVATYQNPAAYRCITMEATSFKNSASGNYRNWNGQCGCGWSALAINALQANNTAIGSIRLFVGGTCQSQAMLKVWGMLD